MDQIADLIFTSNPTVMFPLMGTVLYSPIVQRIRGTPHTLVLQSQREGSTIPDTCYRLVEHLIGQSLPPIQWSHHSLFGSTVTGVEGRELLVPFSPLGVMGYRGGCGNEAVYRLASAQTYGLEQNSVGTVEMVIQIPTACSLILTDEPLSRKQWGPHVGVVRTGQYPQQINTYGLETVFKTPIQDEFKSYRDWCLDLSIKETNLLDLIPIVKSMVPEHYECQSITTLRNCCMGILNFLKFRALVIGESQSDDLLKVLFSQFRLVWDSWTEQNV